MKNLGFFPTPLMSQEFDHFSTTVYRSFLRVTIRFKLKKKNDLLRNARHDIYHLNTAFGSLNCANLRLMHGYVTAKTFADLKFCWNQSFMLYNCTYYLTSHNAASSSCRRQRIHRWHSGIWAHPKMCPPPSCQGSGTLQNKGKKCEALNAIWSALC